MSEFRPNPADWPMVDDEVVTVVDEQSQHLGAIIPTARGRRWAYAGYALVSLVVTNTLIGFSAAQLDAPMWLVVASAIVANLAAPFSALAIANAKR